MNILCHGAPFCCDYTLLDAYRGRHDVRWVGIDPRARYRFDPLHDDIHSLLARIRTEWNPDLLMCWTPEIYPPPLNVEEADIPTAALVSDWNFHFPVLRGNLARFDIVLCDRAGVDVFASCHPNVHHVMPLYSRIPSVHRCHEVERDIDVAYIGSLNVAAHPRRARLLHRLSRLSDRYRVVIASGVRGEAYAQLLSRAKLVFNCSVRGEMNLRVFETIACGAAPMIERDNLEVRDWLEDGRSVIFYDDDTLEETVGETLASERWRGVAADGYARSETLAGENRLDTLIDWLSRALPVSDRGFLSLPDEERRYQDLLLYGFCRWPEYVPLRVQVVGELIQRNAGDPRHWTLLGRHLLPGGDVSAHGGGVDDAIKAFTQAHRLCKESAAYALNAATVCRAFGLVEKEEVFLGAVLAASSTEGAELVVGNPGCHFWNRWIRAVAEGKATLSMLHAEAHVRLGVVLAATGRAVDSLEHLMNARELDVDNHSGNRLEAEILWALGRRTEAVAFLAEHVEEAPLDAEYLRRLGEMARETGDLSVSSQISAELRRLEQALAPPTGQNGQGLSAVEA